MGKVIGIDLGTTNSCVAFVDNGEPVVIPNGEGSRTTPSVVAFTKEGERRVGSVAKRQAQTNPENTVFAVKRLMGQLFEDEDVQRHKDIVSYRVIQNTNGDAWIHVAGKDYSPPEISAMILETMREVAESYLGEEVTEAVVTVPRALLAETIDLIAVLVRDGHGRRLAELARVEGLDAATGDYRLTPLTTPQTGDLP